MVHVLKCVCKVWASDSTRDVRANSHRNRKVRLAGTDLIKAVGLKWVQRCVYVHAVHIHGGEGSGAEMGVRV